MRYTRGVVDLADSENCDVIVMGRRGLRRLERVLVGSVTARVIGHTKKMSLLCPEELQVGWKNILLATDGSKHSDIAANKAINFAKSYGGELLVISVVDVPSEFYAEAPQVVDDMARKAKRICCGN